MEKLAAYLPDVKRWQKGPSENSVKPAQSADFVVRFFARMRHLYGHRWESQYGAAVKDGRLSVAASQWAHDLRDFPEAAIVEATRRCESEFKDWPPTVPQFKALCLGLPTFAQVMDRENDYGPACDAIRKRMDWFNLEALPTRHMLRLAERQYESALVNVNRSGVALDFVQQQAIAQG